MCNQLNSPNTQNMEEKFDLWSITSKYLLFCKLDASRLSKGKEFKDVNGKDGKIKVYIYLSMQEKNCF